MVEIADVVVRTGESMRDAIARIDVTGQQFAIVLDPDDRLRGIVTDGDIRRALLRGVSLEAPVTEVMNEAPKTAHIDEPDSAALALMQKYSLQVVPVVDSESRVVALVRNSGRVHSAAVSNPVVLMAGGRGQRLYPLTKDVPKPMLPIGDTPLLELILRRLASQGFREVYISVNYLAHVIMDHVGDGSQFGLRVQYLHEDQPLGTAGALFQLKNRIVGPFVVMNSDLLTHVNMRRLLHFHDAQGLTATVGVREYAFEVPFGVVDLDGSRVVAMVEKPVHRSLVNSGIYVLNPEALQFLDDGEYQDMPTLLGKLMEDDRAVGAFPIHEPWLDVGRPEDLDRARSGIEKWTTE